ncbi:chorismate mutase [Hansschlegelia beijingensis]|uniref:chorismate mutase n=1 Tax=Hansschlegelia beijingensis TaxID=1133344 RepID=A0A7W6CZG0_9HYPH|nr:chorismate mutase [Hansschlegelia beijingensis]MBB3973896.1 chorismate mutase [Hansschlegelia beijingensis]
MNDAFSDPLADIRREIDRIDEAMHLLLMERGAVIDRLVEIKRTSETGSAFRPAREADMMRRLAARHQGRLPLATAEHLWRTIIATFTHVQAPFTLHVEQGARALEMHDLARFHVGFDVPLEGHGTAARVVEAVRGSTGDLGLVRIDPAPAAAWWEGLGGDGPHVMARLPFFPGPQRPAPLDAFVIARPLGPAAAAEVTVWSTTDDGGEELGNEAETIATVTRNGQRNRLVAVRGDAPPAPDARPVGGYAAPFAP